MTGLTKGTITKGLSIKSALKAHENSSHTTNHSNCESTITQRKLVVFKSEPRQKGSTSSEPNYRQFSQVLSLSVMTVFLQIKQFFAGLIIIALVIYDGLYLASLASAHNSLRAFSKLYSFVVFCYTKLSFFKENCIAPAQGQIKAQISQMGHEALKNYNKLMEANLEKKPLTLVLDLDETLVHSSMAKPNAPHEEVTVYSPEGSPYTVYVQKRPYLDYFIEKVSYDYNLVIFTASKKEYADPVISHIDKYCLLSKRKFRESCIKTPQGYIKDLTTIEPDLGKIVLVDNAEISGVLHPDNILLIKAWYSGEDDKELLKFVNILTSYAAKHNQMGNNKMDIRKYIREMQSQLD